MVNCQIQVPETTDQGGQERSAMERLTAPDRIRAAVFVVFSALLVLAWTRNVNWDEFFFLSHVHAYLNGRLDRELQTFFVHVFGWLDAVPGHEMGQIFAARLLMTACLGVTVFSIFRIASVFANRPAAWIAVLAFLTSGFVLPHGTSFRADPIATCLLMSALAILLTSRFAPWQLVALALLCAFALLATIKSALYLPAFLGAILWRLGEPGALWRILLAGFAGLGIAALLFLWHSHLIETPPGREAVSTATGAFNTVLLDNSIFPRWRELALWAVLSLALIALIVIGMAGAGSFRRGAVFVMMLMPFLVSAVFYRNTFPYFFPFIVPPMVVVAAIGAARLKSNVTLGALVALMIGTGTWQAAKSFSEGAEVQRRTLAEVHRLFPEPVPYIDHNAMISSFPRDGFFMSSWGVLKYRSQGQPVMAEIIDKTHPPLLLANRWALHSAMTEPDAPDHPLYLFPDDAQILRDTYVHYSGVIWLAGRDIKLDDAPLKVEMHVHGRYRIETDAPVMIDGVPHHDGDVLNVTGPLRISGRPEQTLRLIWDTSTSLRDNPLPAGGVYAGFWRLPI